MGQRGAVRAALDARWAAGSGADVGGAGHRGGAGFGGVRCVGWPSAGVAVGIDRVRRDDRQAASAGAAGMRAAYRVLASLIAVGVALQVASIALAGFTIASDAEDGATI